MGSEMSIHFDNSSKKYLLFYSPDGLSWKGAYRKSKYPWGFSNSTENYFYTIPAQKKSDYFAYAIKAHTGLMENNNEIVFSFVVNSFVPEDLNNDPDIYFPVFQKINIKNINRR
jgi:hypothetical protein